MLHSVNFFEIYWKCSPKFDLKSQKISGLLEVQLNFVKKYFFNDFYSF